MTTRTSIHREMTRLMDEAPLTPVHWKIWWLSAMGIFLDGFDLFIIGVALPLIMKTFPTSPYIVGLIGAAAVLGAVVGASVGGTLSDRWGRKALYILDLGVFIVLSVFSAFSWNVVSLIAFRFLLGIGIGADYPICASYISAFMPTRSRGRMLIGAFSFQALGMAAGAAVGLVILKIFPHFGAWRFMLAFGALPAIVVILLRMSVPESARWYLLHGKHTEAAEVIKKLVPSSEGEIHELAAKAHRLPEDEILEKPGHSILFSKKYIKRTILAVVPWFLMDIITYAVGIFTPIILATMAFSGSGLSTIAGDFKATEGAMFLDLFLVVGFLINIMLIDKWGRIKLQLFGFGGMSLGLLILAASTVANIGNTGNLILVFAGFIIFNVLMNMGPNATTSILPAELYPTNMRGSGHGFAAAVAKLGAAVGIFMLPVVKASVGMTFTLIMLAMLSVLAFMVTLVFRVETKNRSLEELSMML
ncbi:MAG: MFS transporter [Candidatus Tantalella remota]|nr:MFS transporter [Candidatus Tantalella remota]